MAYHVIMMAVWFREALPRGPTSKQRDGLKITEGLEGERMIEEEKFKNRKKVFWSIDSESAVEAKQTIDR